jgi:putative tryptophan/tyrosine transport system substrate-binding protein
VTHSLVLKQTAAICAVLFGLCTAATAQQTRKVARIGLLSPGNLQRQMQNPRVQAFFQGLLELGWVEGKNLTVERRFANDQLSQLDGLAIDLAALKVDVIVTAAFPSAKAAKNATSRIPIVILDPGDPVGTGLVKSLARPGGNVTGISSIAPDLAAKRLQLLKEAAPKISRVAVLFNDEIPPAEIAMKELETTAGALKLDLESLPVKSPNGFDNAFDVITQQHVDALIVFADPLTFSNSDIIVNFANRSRRPALYAAQEFVDAGGLMSYGPSYPNMFRRGAHFVDRILKGVKPADLPVEQPMQFDFVINLKAAKQIGLTIPPNVLARADRVIR